MSFPQTRRCPFTGRTAFLAPARAARPMTLEHSAPHHRDRPPQRDCPFCPGAEHDTPDPVLTFTENDTWSFRVVPNRYPAVEPDGPAIGLHEVLIECREHEPNPVKLAPEQFARVFQAYRQRMLAHAADGRYGYTNVFKNVGAEAGASLAHSHSQLVAVAEVPEAVALEMRIAGEYHARYGRCLMCDTVAAELADGSRVIAATERFAAFAAFAPRFDYEFWVAPRFHHSRMETADDDTLAELTGLFQRVLKTLDDVLAEPAYNLVLHTGPLRSEALPHFHWHWECLPRTARVAGFEWGSGAFIVAVPPEQAAAELRG
jgi:UDPglucose--hexose-1-phosphate uridylyltransferase